MLKLLKLALVLCCVLALVAEVDGAKAAKGKSKKKGAKKGGARKKKDDNVDPDVNVLLFCDVCQTIVHYVHKEVQPAKKSFQGALQVRLQKVISNESACRTMQSEFGGKLGGDLKTKFHNNCKDMWESMEGYLEETIESGISERDLAQGVCVDQAQYCPEGLWPAGKHVTDKESEAERNEREGKSFLELNKMNEGVKVTKSGLQYTVETKGEGTVKPKKTDTVKVHYKGTLLNGEEFDSSYKRGEPASFGVSGVIAGWTQALQLMVKGDKFNLVIPWQLAYGEGGSGAKIGPRALLKFDVELLEIVGVTDKPAEAEGAEGVTEGVGKQAEEAKDAAEAPKDEL